MKRKLQQACPWMFWVWYVPCTLLRPCLQRCYLKPTLQNNDNMLLRLHFLYSKSPKELSDIAEDLKEVFEFPKSGNLPVRSQGSKWINHKHKVLQKFVDRYGVYISQLLTLVEDKTIKNDDRAKLERCLQKWRDAHQFSTVCGHTEIFTCVSLCLKTSSVALS